MDHEIIAGMRAQCFINDYVEHGGGFIEQSALGIEAVIKSLRAEAASRGNCASRLIKDTYE